MRYHNSRLLLFVTVKFQTGGLSLTLVTLTQPESNPSAKVVHGALNVDWVTEWLPLMGKSVLEHWKEVRGSTEDPRYESEADYRPFGGSDPSGSKG